MTVFGDLNISTIDELPPGRQEIKTRIYRDKDREAVYDLIRGELQEGAAGLCRLPPCRGVGGDGSPRCDHDEGAPGKGCLQ